jgi:hypothetical protein
MPRYAIKLHLLIKSNTISARDAARDGCKPSATASSFGKGRATVWRRRYGAAAMKLVIGTADGIGLSQIAVQRILRLIMCHRNH